MPDTVELIRAFAWMCEDCGRDNFERARVFAPEEIDLENLPEMPGTDPEEVREWLENGGRGDFLTAPDTVRCLGCGASFRTTVA